ncbi:GPP34 family phosphoprotein [Streptomyces sp. NPDC004065]|uniref:GPP34 family phosphoprotein n=1 Tax=Streptomyces sp. NPDC004065 TaxID=3364689 RepID=UPI00384B3EBD
MSTPRDLMIVALDVPASRPPARGDLSLALAGAEAYDLLRDDVLRLDGDRIVPRVRAEPADRLLEAAACSLVRQVPYESLPDWLWRRGNGLASAYLAALEQEGQITFERCRWLPFRTGRTLLSDTEARRRAAYRWAADEPVLLALAAAVGIGEETAATEPGITDDAVLTVLAAVHEAVMELEAVRQRRAIEAAAFANVWRGA